MSPAARGDIVCCVRSGEGSGARVGDEDRRWSRGGVVKGACVCQTSVGWEEPVSEWLMKGFSAVADGVAEGGLPELDH